MPRRQPVEIYLPRPIRRHWFERWASSPYVKGALIALLLVESIRPFLWCIRIAGRFLIAHFGSQP